MRENNYIVYMHKCPNNKVYIGITCQGIRKRWRSNGYGYKKNKHFYSAIQKYGWNNIEHIIIAENINEKDAYELEIKLIKKYKSNIHNYGYNNSTGGEKSAVGVKHTEETKKKLSEAHKDQKPSFKGKHHTEEAKKIISITSKGRPSFWKGKKLSEEHRKKLSESHKGQKMSEEAKAKMILKLKGRKFNDDVRRKISAVKKGKPSHLRKKVQCIEDGKTYSNIMEAQRTLKTHHIGEACSGKRKTAGGYHWKYI